jgi:hypothetical protein
MKKIIIKHVEFEIQLPSLTWQNWVINSNELVSPEGRIYTPGKIRLLKWKSGFYDRQMELYLPTHEG